MNLNENLLATINLKKYFPIESGFFKQAGDFIRAVDDISFTINKGEIVGLVGESGSGKTTTGKMITGLLKPTSGKIMFENINILNIKRKELGLKVQIIFQNPLSSLNPKLSIGTIIGEAVRLRMKADKQLFGKTEVLAQTEELLETVGLSRNITGDYPHQFSGGQRQRIGIARALAMKPQLIIADEPVSSLDISIQAQILNLLSDLKDIYGLSYLLITHDLNIVKHICNRIIVMYNGKIVEEGLTASVYNAPAHPYTKKLLASAPELPKCSVP